MKKMSYVLILLLFSNLGFSEVPESHKKEIRCGTLKKKHDSWSLEDCLIARPRFDGAYSASAGWNKCVITRLAIPNYQKKFEIFVSQNNGKFVCMQGRHEGFGQFSLDLFVDIKNKYEIQERTE